MKNIYIYKEFFYLEINRLQIFYNYKKRQNRNIKRQGFDTHT